MKGDYIYNAKANIIFTIKQSSINIITTNTLFKNHWNDINNRVETIILYFSYYCKSVKNIELLITY